MHKSIKQFFLYDNRVLGVMIFCASLPMFSSIEANRQAAQDAQRDAESASMVAASTRAIVAKQKTNVSRTTSRPDEASMAEATAAKGAIYDRAFRLQSGYCSQFARMVAQKSQGSEKYRYLFGASAIESANRFLKYSYGHLWPSEKAKLGGTIQPGDFLFKRYGSGGYGHVGIYAGNGLVAENSSTRYGRIQGAKGYRTLRQFGYFDVVGRLPDPNPKLVPNHRAVRQVSGTGE